jgi:hypothetical protein
VADVWHCPDCGDPLEPGPQGASCFGCGAYWPWGVLAQYDDDYDRDHL